MIKERAFFITWRARYDELLITIRWRHFNGAVTWNDYVVTTIGMDGIE